MLPAVKTMSYISLFSVSGHGLMSDLIHMCVCVCACVRACVRACASVCELMYQRFRTTVCCHPLQPTHVCMDTLLVQWCLLFTYFTLCCSLFNAVSEGSQQEPQGRAQSDHHGVGPSSTALPSGECV